jgi:hypothetical protein
MSPSAEHVPLFLLEVVTALLGRSVEEPHAASETTAFTAIGGPSLLSRQARTKAMRHLELAGVVLRRTHMRIAVVTVAGLILAGMLHSALGEESSEKKDSEPQDECRTFKKARDSEEADLSKRDEAAKQYEICVLNALAAGRDPATGRPFPEAGQEFKAVVADARVEDAAAGRKAIRKLQEFQGLKWGVGFGFAISSGDLITEAAVVDGVVRATKDESERAIAILEGHNYLKACQGDGAKRGCGPYLGVIADSNDVLAGVSLGFMFGWKSEQDPSSQGFSIGLGALLQNDIKDLADGFSENEPLPPGESDVRFVEKGRWSAVLFATRTF